MSEGIAKRFEIIGVLKEVFFQKGEPGSRPHWVVFYWPSETNPAIDTHKAMYFNTLKECKEFEKLLIDYDDWYTSQEELLAVQ